MKSLIRPRLQDQLAAPSTTAATDLCEFWSDSTDAGRDVSEGEMGYRIEERGGLFALVEFLADEPFAGEVLELMSSREQAEACLREYLEVRA